MSHYAATSLFLSLLLTYVCHGNTGVPVRYDDVIPADKSEIAYQYTFNELEHCSPILCPKGFFIAEIDYKIRDIQREIRDGMEQKWTTLQVTHVKMSRNIRQLHSDVRSSVYGPCGTLVYCLGYQACIFSVSVEFCLQDPIPGYRKWLYLNVTCSRYVKIDAFLASRLSHHGGNPGVRHPGKNITVLEDDVCFSDEFLELYNTASVIRERIAKVTFIRADIKDSTREEKGQKLVRADIDFIVSDKSEVFHQSCPGQDMARRIGYEGSCFNDPPDVRTVTDDTWILLGRTKDRRCRDELLQVYCSYHYDGNGNCRPPFATQPEVQTGWSFVSQPELGTRPDDTTHQHIYITENKGLVPARLAFVLLVHKSPESVVELLDLLYRPQHSYVIHVDLRSSFTQELEDLFSVKFANVSNIRILERSRSFPSSWGSYQILRAITEAAEQSLRMNLWDFLLTISGSDLPLRNVDDLAKMLAPYRGKSFMSTSGKPLDWNKDKGVHAAWHACGGHLYNVTLRERRQEHIYQSSTWAIYSRELVEFFVQPQADGNISAGLMYYMQTNLIADESYYATLAMNSRHKESITFRGFTLQKPFVGEDSKNLCRHRHETDTCGRGPTTFKAPDITVIPGQTHVYFFARKFSTARGDSIRKRVISDVKNDLYKKEHKSALPGAFIYATALLGLRFINRKYSISSDLGLITDLSVIPRLASQDPCCQVVLDNGHYITQDYGYWLDMILNSGTQNIPVRSITVPKKPLFYTCYNEGQIRALHITTRNQTQLYNPQSGPSRMMTPMPYEWSGSRIMWLNVAIQVTNSVPDACKGRRLRKYASEVLYANWPKHPQSNVDGRNKITKLAFLIVLMSPDGRIFEKHTKIDGPPPITDIRQRDIVIHSEPLQFGPFLPGWWTLNIQQFNYATFQTEVENPYIYQQRVLLLPRLTQTDNIYGRYLGDEFINEYFKVEAAALLSDLHLRHFYQDMTFTYEPDLHTAQSIYDNKQDISQVRQLNPRTHEMATPISISKNQSCHRDQKVSALSLYTTMLVLAAISFVTIYLLAL